MVQIHPAILGGDPFSDVFRGLYNHKHFWKLANPDYCLQVMKQAYAAGTRAFDLSFPENVQLFNRLNQEVEDEIVAYGNPTWLQGIKLEGKNLQHRRDEVIKTVVENMPAEKQELINNRLREEAFMVFGYDGDTRPLSPRKIDEIYLDEDVFKDRLKQLDVSTFMMVGGTDADWLFSLGREDLVQRIVEITRQEGYRPLLICHYASIVLEKARKISLDVDGYVIPINKEWSWLSLTETLKSFENIDKPVVSFMALSGGSLKGDVRGSLKYLFDLGIKGILFGATRPTTAYETSKVIQELTEG